MKLALVLGAGGLVGVAHHVGVLRALEQEAGLVPDKADLVVGTSAGAAIGAYVRAGWTTEDLWERVSSLRHAAPSPAAGNAVDLARRLVGSTYVAARSAVPIPNHVVFPRVPRILRRVFPAGLFTMGAAPRLLEEDLPSLWPARPLWLCAIDIETGRREVFGRAGGPDVPLVRAVLASCAIPGVYPPVPLNGRAYVDGGVHSHANLDLAASFGCDVALCVAPMAYDLAAPPLVSASGLVRAWPTVSLRAEIRAARRAGTRTIVLAPGLREVRTHGWNLMRPEGLDQVAAASYEATARAVTASRLGEMLAGAVSIPQYGVLAGGHSGGGRRRVKGAAGG
jgi:NTE family protein